jgi:hypothetical protein
VPTKLPAHEFAPVAVEVHGTVAMEHGGHPPALREAIVAIAKDVSVDVDGLPRCQLRSLESSGVAAARHLCRKAVVGSGIAHVGFASSEEVVKVPLTLFNGGASDGGIRLLVHGAIALPNPTPVVGVAKIQKRQDGLRATWRLPRIHEGDGSLLDFKFKVGRSFASKGMEHSYLAARCGKGSLQTNISKAVFVNEANMPGQTQKTTLKGSVVVPCTPRR